MSDVVMVIDHVDVGTGEVLSRMRTTEHGWTSPGEAVKHWRSLTSFTPYENGRVTVNASTGLETRVYFDVTDRP